MKKVLSLLVMSAFASMLPFAAANAEGGAPVQFTFFDFNAPKADAVSGVRFPAIYGKGGGDIVGLDFGLLAYSEMRSLKGVSWSLFPQANRISGDMTGASLSLFNWHEGQDVGVNLGLFNLTNNVKGLNWAALNYSKGYTVADVGLVNISKKSNFQLSFVNITEEINGVQIGIVSCAKNGFLPCFVLFNFGKSGS